MNTHFSSIPGYIKYLSIIDRDSTPILSFNLSSEEEELAYQLMIYSSLDILNSTDINKDSKQTSQEEFVGLLMPFYDFDYDLGAYGFNGNNGYQIVVIKKLEREDVSSDKKLSLICKDIYDRFVKLLLNPFYDKKLFSDVKSPLRNNFSKGIVSILKQNQII